jgi:hypothetical protein
MTERKQKKAVMGRPPLAAKDKRSFRVNVRFRPDEYRALRASAAREGITMSDVLLNAWRRDREGD